MKIARTPPLPAPPKPSLGPTLPPLPVRRLARLRAHRCSRCGVNNQGHPWVIETDAVRYCAPCVKQMRAGWKPPDESQLRRKYGIGLDEYGRMYLEQGGVCAICRDRGKRTTSTRRTLHVDHDHATGKVRALLCGRCNAAIGLLGEDAFVLRAAIDYLARHAPQPEPRRVTAVDMVEKDAWIAQRRYARDQKRSVQRQAQ